VTGDASIRNAGWGLRATAVAAAVTPGAIANITPKRRRRFIRKKFRRTAKPRRC
jgi:hypothetical protein